MILLEAMALGVPVVTTAVGGIPEVVREDEAILVPSENPSALAAAIRSVSSDPTGAAKRAERATQRLADAFSTEQWLDKYDRVYATSATESANAR